MNIFRKMCEWLTIDPHQRIGVRILQICIGASFLFQICTEIPFAAYLWGPKGIGWGITSPILGPILGVPFDRVFTTDVGVILVLFLLGTGASGLVLGYATHVATILVCGAFFFLSQRLPEITDGGDNMTQLVLVYMLFLLPFDKKISAGALRVWLHNIAVLAITLQLVIMYIASGFAKAAGDVWQQGIAMYYVSQVQEFTLPGAHELFMNPWVVTIATYVPMFYQLLFPVAIISRIKVPWILLGILFHLGIAILMGLITFSTVMIGLELFLISDREYAMIWNRASCLLKNVQHSLTRR